MIKNNLILFLLIFVLGIQLACEKPDKQENILSKEEALVFSMLIDELAMALPLPPMPSADNLEEKFAQTNWDSIRAVKTKLVLDTVMFQTSVTLPLPADYKSFKSLSDTIKNLERKTINYSLIKSMEGHELIFGNSLDDFEGKYPQMIFMSRVAFDKNYNKAMVFAGLATTKLAGFLNLYLLEKKNGVWEIIYKKNVIVS